MNDFDWNQLRAFYATATTGSLSAAARDIGQTQPTLSRQIAALEASLGVTLFERVGKRLVLTETGHGLLEHVRVMGEAALATRLSASGHAEKVEGRVSISATDSYAAWILPDIIDRIRAEAPQITVTVISSNKFSDLKRREADIAVRHMGPQDPDLIGKRVLTSAARVYAGQAWIARHGMPTRPEDIAGHLIGSDDLDSFAMHMKSIGVPVDVDKVRLTSDSSIVVWELVKRGAGVTVMLDEIAVRTPEAVHILPDLPVFEVPLWVVTHRELRTSRRIRVVFDILAEELAALNT